MPRKKPIDYERVRGSKACTFCSRRKIKCDGNDPCSACHSRSIDCIYVEGKKRGPPSRTELERKATGNVNGRSHHAPSPTPSFSADCSRSSDDDHEHHTEHQDSQKVKRARFEQDASPWTASVLPPMTPLDELATLAHQSRAASPGSTFDGYDWSSSALSDQGTNSTRTSISHRELQSFFAMPPQTNTPSTLQTVRDFNTASGDQLGSSSSGQFSYDFSKSPISELNGEVVDQLLTVYQSFVHLHWPIIYLPSLSSLRVLADTHPLLYHAVLAVAAGTQDNLNPNASSSSGTAATHEYDSTSPSTSSSLPRPPAVCPPGTAAKLVRYLKQHVKAQDLAKTLEIIQVLILLALVEMGGGDTSDAYVHASTACVLAVDLGLHRSQSGIESTQLYRLEEKQRVLWGCYVLDKVLAAALERPTMLRSDDIDIDLPSTEERDEYDIFVNDRSRHFVAPDRISIMTDVKCRCISSFGAYCNLMMLLERILNQVYSPKARRERKQGQFRNYRQAVVDLDAGLRSWRRNLPRHLQWASENDHELSTSPISDSQTRERKASRYQQTQSAHALRDNVPPQVLTMRAWYSACLLLLHRPRLPLDVASSAARHHHPNADKIAAESIEDSAEAGKSADSSDDSEARQPSAPLTASTKATQAAKTILAVPASELVRAAATEIFHLLPKYQATFSVRRIPSSWVYLIFQSAIIHSSFIEDSKPSSEAPTGQDPISASSAAESDKNADDNESYRLFRQCIRNLEQMALTWRGASHHVATLKRVAESCRITRPSTPVLGPTTLTNLQPFADAELILSQPVVNSGTQASLTPRLFDTPATGLEALISHAAWGPNSQLSEPIQSAGSAANLDWSDFWSQMPSSSEDVWLWQQFIDSFGSSIV